MQIYIIKKKNVNELFELIKFEFLKTEFERHGRRHDTAGDIIRRLKIWPIAKQWFKSNDFYNPIITQPVTIQH